MNPLFEEVAEYWELEVCSKSCYVCSWADYYKILAIDPRFQREGVGSRLLTWGMQQAALHHKPVIVAATANGEQLYRKHGFVECGRITFPNNEFTWTALVWQPLTESMFR